MFVTYEQIDNNTRYSITADSNLKNKLVSTDKWILSPRLDDAWRLRDPPCRHESDAASWQDAVADVTVVNAFVLLKKRRWRPFAPSLSFSAVILGSGSYK